jgi:hypothetical protein
MSIEEIINNQYPDFPKGKQYAPPQVRESNGKATNAKPIRLHPKALLNQPLDRFHHIIWQKNK